MDRTADPAALETVLSSERGKDSLTLWHLLDHGDEEVRTRVFDRLARLSAPPEGVTRSGCISGDPAMLEEWREDLSRLW